LLTCRGLLSNFSDCTEMQTYEKWIILHKDNVKVLLANVTLMFIPKL